MTEAYNDALKDELESGVWDTLKNEATSMSGVQYATLTADIVGIFDPTPISDGVGTVLSLAQGDFLGAGLSIAGMIPYIGDAGKIGKIAKVAPKTAGALEALMKHGDNLAKVAAKGGEFTLEQIGRARAAAMARVRKAMLDKKMKKPDCKDCEKLVGKDGKVKSAQHMPRKGGTWDTPDGAPPANGTGKFTFDEPKVLPDGRTVDSIDYVEGAPDFSPYAYEGKQHVIPDMSGNAQTDMGRLNRQIQAENPGWRPPDTSNTIDGYVLDHAANGTVQYVPRVLHDKGKGGVAHTGGAAMQDTKLY